MTVCLSTLKSFWETVKIVLSAMIAIPIGFIVVVAIIVAIAVQMLMDDSFDEWNG